MYIDGTDNGKNNQLAKLPWGSANPQALNRYSYTLNNPLRYIDPTGHDYYDFSGSNLTDLQYNIQEALRLITLHGATVSVIIGALGGASLGVLSAILGLGTFIANQILTKLSNDLGKTISANGKAIFYFNGPFGLLSDIRYLDAAGNRIDMGTWF